MAEEKKLYPLRFARIDDNESESVHIADLGYQDSLSLDGWLASNTISEIMDMYMDRVVGDHVYDYYGRQFPVLVKMLTGTEITPLLVHPDDETAEQRFDFLGKAKLWYVIDAKPGSRLFLGFKRDVTAEELYMSCRHGDVGDLLNEVVPEPGHSYFIHPGLVHAAGEGVKIMEISESSPLDFRIFNWGREFEGDEFDASLNLEEAFDFIDYKQYHPVDCHDCVEHSHIADKLTDCEEFTVSRINLADPLHIYGGRFDSFVVYTSVAGEALVQVRTEDGKNENYEIGEYQSILIPSEVPDFFLLPMSKKTVLLETIVEKRAEKDSYTGEECGCGEHHHHDGECGCHGHHHCDEDDDMDDFDDDMEENEYLS